MLRGYRAVVPALCHLPRPGTGRHEHRADRDLAGPARRAGLLAGAYVGAGCGVVGDSHRLGHGGRGGIGGIRALHGNAKEPPNSPDRRSGIAGISF